MDRGDSDGLPRRRLRFSLAALVAAIAAIAVCLHFYTLRVREERQRRFRPVAQKAARLHQNEAFRVRVKISFERDYTRYMPYWLDMMRRGGYESKAKPGEEYIAQLRDILPWHERWLDLQLRAKGYYRQFDGGVTRRPAWAIELARAQAELMEERRRLIARHPGVRGLRVPNPMTMKRHSLLPQQPEFIQVPDPFDVQDAPDFEHPGYAFKDLGLAEP